MTHNDCINWMNFVNLYVNKSLHKYLHVCILETLGFVPKFSIDDIDLLQKKLLLCLKKITIWACY